MPGLPVPEMPPGWNDQGRGEARPDPWRPTELLPKVSTTCNHTSQFYRSAKWVHEISWGKTSSAVVRTVECRFSSRKITSRRNNFVAIFSLHILNINIGCFLMIFRFWINLPVTSEHWRWWHWPQSCLPIHWQHTRPKLHHSGEVHPKQCLEHHCQPLQ